MKKILIAIFAVFLLLGIVTFKQTPPPTITTLTPSPKPIDENIMFDLSQRYRSKKDLPPYQKSNFLCSVASQRLEEVKVDWSHEEFLNSMKNNRYCSRCTLSENIAKDWITENRTFESFIKSPTHKAALDAAYTHSCVKSDGNRVVQIFGYQ